ncbi:ROK family protein [Collinsella ihumii]|uniref:ROK family protein n=1 Tax=Collinsella ihumii TaxID=1720204 RepID=UPI003EC06FC2
MEQMTIAAVDIGGTKLAAAVSEACGLPCRVLNDVHAHALGEARWGGGRKASSCLVVAVGTGIGGAIAHPTSLTSWFKAEVEK